MLALIIEFIGLLAGFFVAAELVADGTTRIEPLLGQGIAGGILVGFVGTLPETIFVVIAVLGGAFDIAIGSAIGGNLILFTLGIGTIAIIYSLKWKETLKMKEDYHIELQFLIISTIGICALMLYGFLNFWSGLLLAMIYFVYVFYRYRKAKHLIRKSVSTKLGKRTLMRGMAYITVGVVIVALISGYFVEAINGLSAAFMIPAIWLALVISPLAADINENISGYRLAVKTRGGGSTAIVSYFGSKLQNNTLLLGLIGLLAGSSVALGSAVPALLVVVAVNVIAFIFVKYGRLSFRDGILLIALYFVSIACAIML